ncbi:T9SS sorting signal type C domain-containing protein [Flavobacterium sp. ZT3R17]|uniref:T9SS sorting signal type C domain-containing protein n=1 Tax=Flavobacterium cryoconiti TaxID=3398736 RepID=UPI003A8AEDE3
MKKFLPIVVFFMFFQIRVNGQTNTYTGSNGDWNTASKWSLNLVPTAAHDVVIPFGKIVNISADSFAKTLSVSGILTISDTKRLTVYDDFTVNTGGIFDMGSGSDLTTLVVYGDYVNNGTTDFWKSNVVIAGDLTSVLTSTLQKQGNVVVGGNIGGLFDTFGGDGHEQIYAVNPHASVTIDPSLFIPNVIPGTQVTTPTETTVLVALVNAIIYGGSCSFTVTDPSNVAACSGYNAVFTVGTSGASPGYQWQVNTNNGSGWYDLANDAVYSGVTTTTLTVSSITVAMDKYKYRAKITSASCTKNGNYGVLTVNTSPSAPSVGTITPPTCALATGSVVLSGLPASGTWTLNPGGITGTGTNATITGLSAGTYNYTVSNGTCTSSASSNVVILSLTTTWNGTSWSNGSPTSAKNIVFSGGYTSSSDLAGCSCQVTSGAVVFLNTLTITNGVNVTGGSLTFENNASLVQINNVANSGSITYKRKTTAILNSDYTYWSSPVAGQQLTGVSPATSADKFYSFDGASDLWVGAAPSTTMVLGKGYIIQGPENYSSSSPSVYEASFVGVPNNGDVSISVPTSSSVETSHLIGNPYPSAIDANLFLTANLSALDGTIYFWTHNTAITNNAYTSDDYASYNLTGGAYTAKSISSGVNNTVPDVNIASGQAFFITGKISGAGTIIFNNSMRKAGQNSIFFKFSPIKKKLEVVDKHRVWLNLSNMQGAFKQTLVGYIAGATNDYDNSFDGESFDANEYLDFYSVNQDKDLVIQGRALPFEETDEVPLGFRTTIDGTFAIDIDQVDGLLASHNVFIEDKTTKVIKNLKEGSYTFTTESGTFNDRFVLRFTDKILGTGTFDKGDSAVLVSNKNKLIKIDSSVEVINKVEVYDLLGRTVYEKVNIDANKLVLPNLVMNDQVLLVKIILENGKTVTKKIIY